MTKRVDYPYQIVQQRIDTVVRVPTWAKCQIDRYDLVARIDSNTVRKFDGTLLKIGESYTKFSHYW